MAVTKADTGHNTFGSRRAQLTAMKKTKSILIEESTRMSQQT